MSSETTKTGNAGLVKIAPVMFAFFVMGFVDLVGTATNYVKAEFNLANGTANLFTTMVFFWFLISFTITCAAPTITPVSTIIAP